MPARKNRPGKHGTPPLRDTHREENEEALHEVEKRDRLGVVYWSSDRLRPACERLVVVGTLKRGFTRGSYELVNGELAGLRAPLIPG